ncbi:hypothetical protein F4808DRAFT_425079 [Astrocystis sublimbata]|nr:hypothetical protein F4808DRAFT_425079 [Astrocystis sublimbata]
MASTKNNKLPVRKSRQNPVPTIKFRSSCDACTEAKVRCDKQRPQCSRCTRMDSCCRYSVSLRSGKPSCDLIKALNGGVLTMEPPRSLQTPPYDSDSLTMADLMANGDAYQLFQNAIHTRQGTPSNSTSNYSASSSSDSAPSPPDPIGPLHHTEIMDLDAAGVENNPGSVRSGSNADTPAQNWMDHTTMKEDMSLGAHDMYLSSMMDSASSGFSLPAQSSLDIDYFNNFNFTEQDLLRPFEIPTPNSLPGGFHDGVMPLDPSLQQSPNPQFDHSCLNTAKVLQKSILAMSTRNGQGEINALGCAPTIDQALLMCSNANQKIMEILKCQCKADAHLPFLISVLISKVFATYGAIAKSDDSTPFNIAPASKSQMEQELEQRQRQQQQQHGDAFMSVPLRLGAYDVDRSLEETIRAHIVLHELLKLKSMVQLFDDKYCQIGTDNNPSEGGPIYSALGQFVRDRYAATIAACERTATPSV